MKDCSIAKIKQILNEEIISEAVLQALQADSRKGVQQAVNVYQRKQQKQQLLREQFQEMTKYEREYFAKGKTHIAGIDEVGRGPLAGPVVAAAVILPRDFSLLGLTDSKQLTSSQRETFADEIKAKAVAIGVGMIDNHVIDKTNIYQASILAMEQAVNQLIVQPDQLLIDAVPLKNLSYPSDVIVKGDQKSISIAAASVIAKVHRDHLMTEIHKTYPDYQFNQNQGYGTKAHLLGIEHHGITPYHRLSFAPIKYMIKGGGSDAPIIF